MKDAPESKKDLDPLEHKIFKYKLKKKVKEATIKDEILKQRNLSNEEKKKIEDKITEENKNNLMNEIKELSPLEKKIFEDKINKTIPSEEQKLLDEKLKNKIKDEVILDGLKPDEKPSPLIEKLIDEKVKQRVKEKMDEILSNNILMTPEELRKLEEKK